MRHIAYILELYVGQTSFNYIGVPIFKVKPKTHHLQTIVDVVWAKLATWKDHLLLMMFEIDDYQYSMIFYAY